MATGILFGHRKCYFCKELFSLKIKVRAEDGRDTEHKRKTENLRKTEEGREEDRRGIERRQKEARIKECRRNTEEERQKKTPYLHQLTIVPL